MAFNTNLTVYLSGVTRSQLARWATTGVLVPEISAKPRLYSFRDIVALRTLARLRRSVSLQKIRAALKTLSDQDFTEHLSAYRIACDDKSVKVWTDDGFLDLVDNPGQMEFYAFKDIYAPFENFRGRHVPSLNEPHKGISVDVRRLGGTPTLAGTRVPFDLVSDLTRGDDPMDAAEIADMYPTVTPSAVDDAVSFHEAILRVVA